LTPTLGLPPATGLPLPPECSVPPGLSTVTNSAATAASATGIAVSSAMRRRGRALSKGKPLVNRPVVKRKERLGAVPGRVAGASVVIASRRRHGE
jgi:hypothetical protein